MTAYELRMRDWISDVCPSDLPTICRVLSWNRTAARAEAAAAELGSELGIDVAAITDLEPAIRDADVISAATMATEPMIRGAWLKPGSHVDLVGGFREEMREADDEAIRRARIFVDARFTAAAQDRKSTSLNSSH